MNRCENCGSLCDRLPERCPQCGGFSTLLPFEAPAEVQTVAATLSQDASEIEDSHAHQVSTGFEPWDEALGGGVVLGSSMVVYGGPGARKSTWCASIADQVAHAKRGVALWLSAEMPSWQARDTVIRIRTPKAMRIVGNERDSPDLSKDVREIQQVRPRVVLYDSIQAFDAGGALAGSDWAIVQTVKQGRRLAATLGHLAIFISRVNKAGMPAGPYATIFDCDVIARLEREKVTLTKNRFAPARDATLPE